MSSERKPSKTKTMNTKISDGGMPASRDAVGVSGNCKLSKSATAQSKLSEVEATFDDSGIHSAELSQTYSAEVDARYALSSECGSRSQFRTQSPSSSSSSWMRTISEQLDNVDKEMGLSGTSITDSGVYTDVSERLSDCAIKEDCAENDAKLNQSTESTTTTTTTTTQTKKQTPPSRDDLLRQIFTQDEDGDTQLHLAIIRNDLKIVTEILKIIPSADYVNMRNYHRQTCLHLSVLMNSVQISRLLVLAGARTNMEDRYGNTPLHLACKCNNVECLGALLNPLSVYEEKYFVFRYKPVIARSIDCLNQYNYDGIPCLHLAAEHKDRQILGQLLMYGADVNISECKGGYTLLHEAVESGDINLVDYILRHPGIDVHRKNYARRTAYQLASRHPSIRQLLLESGSQLFPSDDDEDSETESEESDDEDTYNNSV